MDEVGRKSRPVALALVIAGSLALLGASKPLNPLVVRSSKATMPVPPECEEGLSQVPARVDATTPETEVAPAAIPAPPSRDLQAALADAQGALESSDLASFNAAVASVKAMLTDYPTGDERRVAEEIVQIYDDAAKIWTGQFESPFFSESSEAYRIAAKYPGYAEAVRRQVFVDRDGNRFYPADETRDFLTRLAAEDLARLGVKVEPGQVARAPRAAAQDDDNVPPLPAVVARTVPEPSVSTPARPSTATAPVPATAARPTTRPSRPPIARGSAKPSAPKPAPARAATPPVPDELPPTPPPVVATAQPPSKPEPKAPALTTSEPVPAVVETTATMPATTPELSTALETAVTTTTVAPASPRTMPPATTIPATQPAKTRSVLLSVILILIGVGVLVLLFRTAD